MDVIHAGCTLLIVEPPKPHLWVVITDPVGNPASVVTVMLVTRKRFTDDTVILGNGDHPFLDRETSVDFGSARHRRVSAIIAAMTKRRCAMKDSLSPELLERIQRGLLTSPHTVHAFRRHCEPLFRF